MTEQRLTRKDYALLASLVAFAFVPSINQLVIDRLAVSTDVLDIAGQIEWFDLFNETLLAFLIVPLYFVFNRARDDAGLSSRISTTFLAGVVLYSVALIAIYVYASGLAVYMSAPDESVAYLRLETVGFAAGFVSSYMYVVFVVRGRSSYVMMLLISRAVMLAIGDTMLIPEYGALGIAATNIMANLIMSAVSAVLLFREGLVRGWTGLDRGALRDWLRTGVFSGGQVFIANLVYMAVVMRMVGEVSQMGDYWLANNFIWGWLIVPVAAVGEMVKREYFNGYRRIWNYLALVTVILVLWLISVPLWDMMFRDVIGMEDPSSVLDILHKSVPFYTAYAYSVVIQAVLVSVGRTDYIFCEQVVVNVAYYGLVYGLFLYGSFQPSMDFAILIFGIGLLVCLVIDVVLYLYSRKHVPCGDPTGIRWDCHSNPHKQDKFHALVRIETSCEVSPLPV